MKRAIAAAAALVLTVSLTGCGSNSVSIHGTKFARDAYSVKLDSVPMDSLEQLDQITGLRVLDLTDAPLTPDDFAALQKRYPQAAILWTVPFGGSSFLSEALEITVQSLTDADLELLRCFTRLSKVDVSGCTDLTQIAKLKEQYPELDVVYQIPLGGSVYAPEEASITPTGVSASELAQALPLFSQLEQVDLRKSGISSDEADVLLSQFPDVRFLMNVQIAGQTISPDTEELEFTGTDIPLAEIEAAIPFCPNLKKVVLLDSGLTNEQLSTLNQRYPDVQIVWNMHIGLVPVRTDDNYFAPITYNFARVWGSEEFEKLHYMTEVECVDLGHNQVYNIDWVKNMPKLKYLILADTPITDIEALGGHPSLIYLEIFSTAVSDYTPLTTCLKLEDINISRTRGDPEPLAKMTWLKNIWWGDNQSEINMSEQNIINRKKAEELLPSALPNTNVKIFIGAPTLQGWRDLPNYFAMRDCLGMFYMKGSTD